MTSKAFLPSHRHLIHAIQRPSGRSAGPLHCATVGLRAEWGQSDVNGLWQHRMCVEAESKGKDKADRLQHGGRNGRAETMHDSKEDDG